MPVFHLLPCRHKLHVGLQWWLASAFLLRVAALGRISGAPCLSARLNGLVIVHSCHCRTHNAAAFAQVDGLPPRMPVPQAGSPVELAERRHVNGDKHRVLNIWRLVPPVLAGQAPTRKAGMIASVDDFRAIARTVAAGQTMFGTSRHLLDPTPDMRPYSHGINCAIPVAPTHCGLGKHCPQPAHRSAQCLVQLCRLN